jgi:hypothetical protein
MIAAALSAENTLSGNSAHLGVKNSVKNKKTVENTVVILDFRGLTF